MRSLLKDFEKKFNSKREIKTHTYKTYNLQSAINIKYSHTHQDMMWMPVKLNTWADLTSTPFCKPFPSLGGYLLFSTSGDLQNPISKHHSSSFTYYLAAPDLSCITGLVEYFRTMGWTPVPYIGRQTLYHWTTRKVPVLIFSFGIILQLCMEGSWVKDT